MLNRTWREKTWRDIDQPWDIIVIGGGITGAGIFNMAAQKGLSVLLVEARDFAFGTSSRSSKLIHGGIRYLRNRQFDVVRESVKEREYLVRDSDMLVDPMAFIFPSYETQSHETKMMEIGVVLYDLIGRKWQHKTLNPHQVRLALPGINDENLSGGVQYKDARVDDSQLVLRVIMDGVRFGGSAINYAKVVGLLKPKNGRVVGVLLEDLSGTIQPSQVTLKSRVVINATGPWSDELRKSIGGKPRLRRLRGSHLVFSQDKLPLNAAVTLLHPGDNRAMFAIPWENRTIVGTTDLDHDLEEDETRITRSELEYILDATQHVFPKCSIGEEDILSTFSGLRPVINTNAPSPSLESRAHQIWEEDGLVSIAGGKLTIFRVMAADVLNFCGEMFPGRMKFSPNTPCFIHPNLQYVQNINKHDWLLMAGRLGQDVNAFFEESDPELLKPITPLPEFWAELAWAAKNEAVVHLDDLLLRRVRIGLLMPSGGKNLLEHIRELVQVPLGWSNETWASEVSRYNDLWRRNYYLPS